MKYELVKLVVHWLCNWVVMYSNLAKNKLNFIFAKISFGMNMKAQRNPNYKKGNLVGWECSQ